MADKNKRGRELAINDSRLAAMLEEGIKNSVCFDNDASEDRREKALEYLKGILKDLPAEDGRSKLVSRDVEETIDAMMPGLMRVFDAEKVVVYSPMHPDQEEAAAQATEYVNYVWANETDGYLALFSGIWDALSVRNGIMKAFWDETPETEIEGLTGLTELQVAFLLENPEIELLAASPRVETIPGPEDGALEQVELWDIRIRRSVSGGKLVVGAVPPEDFGVAKGTVKLDDSTLVWEKTRKTRSELLKEGYKREIVDRLGADDDDEASSEADLTREEREESGGAEDNSVDRSTEEIEVIECYPLVDLDGDGIAERWRVLKAGSTILDKEPWPDDLPYVDLVGMIVPHRWQGKSVADVTMDVQRSKTALWRGFADNLYSQNRPQREVVERDIINPDEVLRPRFGGVIRVRNAGAVRDLVPAFVGDKVLLGLNYADQVLQRRTGVNGATAALDSTALEPQTATAEQLEHDSNYSRSELVARNLAKVSLPRLFSKILRIIVRNQDRPRTIMLRKKWVDFDPRSWAASMNTTINIGQGTGSRERDLKMLGGVAMKQEQIMERLGLDNPVVRPSMYVSTIHKMIEASGLEKPEQYVGEVDDETFAKWFASKPKPEDPKVEQAKALLGVKVEEGKAKMALAAQKQAGDQAARQEKAKTDTMMRAAEGEAKMQERRAELDQKMTLERERLELDFQLRLEELDRETELRHLELEQEATLEVGKIAVGAATSIQSVGGDTTNVPRPR